MFIFMKHLILTLPLFLIGAHAAPAQAQSVADEILQASEGLNRFIVTCSNTEGAPDTTFGMEYIKTIDGQAFIERDILMVSVMEEPRTAFILTPQSKGPYPNMWVAQMEADIKSLTEFAACKKGQNSVALIGKDGTTKRTWMDIAPTNEEMLAIIDAMPMRQEEMREKDE